MIKIKGLGWRRGPELKVTTRKKITNKIPKSATPKSPEKVSALDMVLDSIDGGPAENQKFLEYTAAVPDWYEQFLAEWDKRDAELGRLEATAAVRPNSAFSKNLKRLKNNFTIGDIIQFLRIAQQKGGPGAHPKDRTARIFAEFERTPDKWCTQVMATKYNIKLPYLRTLHARWKKKKQTLGT